MLIYHPPLGTEQFGKDLNRVLPQQSWVVFDDLSSVIFVEVEIQILGRVSERINEIFLNFFFENLAILLTKLH